MEFFHSWRMERFLSPAGAMNGRALMRTVIRFRRLT
jgi:hypothetical protein